MTLSIRPLTLREANAYVALHHRHNKPVVGHRFSIGVSDSEGVLHGVAIVGHPVARRLDDGLTVEIYRVCTDGAYNACSMLYGACARIAREMGYKRIITYIISTRSRATPSTKRRTRPEPEWTATRHGTLAVWMNRCRSVRLKRRNNGR